MRAGLLPVLASGLLPASEMWKQVLIWSSPAFVDT